MKGPEVQVYTQCPDGMSFWIPQEMAAKMAIRRGFRFNERQFQSPEIQGLIERRLAAQLGRRGR